MDACLHPRTAIRYRFIAGGAKIVQSQCIDCGASVGGAISQKDKTHAWLSALDGWDDTLNLRARTEWELGRDKRMDENAAKNAAWWAWYDSYLKSPAWLYKRGLVLERDQYVCRGCLVAPATQAHHLTYAHVGHELLFELVAVCKACHGGAHEKSKHGSPPTPIP